MRIESHNDPRSRTCCLVTSRCRMTFIITESVIMEFRDARAGVVLLREST